MSSMPCGNTVAERLHAREQGKLGDHADKEMRRLAREELIEELLDGKRIGRHDLESVLEEQMDKNGAALLRTLYEHFAGIGSATADGRLDRCESAAKWLRIHVEHLVDTTDGLIDGRVEELERAAAEDAQ